MHTGCAYGRVGCGATDRHDDRKTVLNNFTGWIPVISLSKCNSAVRLESRAGLEVWRGGLSGGYWWAVGSVV